MESTDCSLISAWSEKSRERPRRLGPTRSDADSPVVGAHRRREWKALPSALTATVADTINNPAGFRSVTIRPMVPSRPQSARYARCCGVEECEWDRRDSNTGPTDPIRRGYHYPTVPRISTEGAPAFNLFVSIRARRGRVPARRPRRCRRRGRRRGGRDTAPRRRAYSRPRGRPSRRRRGRCR